MNLPVNPAEVGRQQSEALREYYRERLAFYRKEALKFPGGGDPVYQKEAEK